ncbi:uncharacterized protein PAC_07163 [Phialocephala subalpina]|uniref:Aminoglycoside phosphotransferase domain-containing protein n=1 Tax=Phialocephala subalpina TaxID=576137 RepID=A0A1L7WWX9_9HELO|nr:uncharacterized protein PAC_07163 [Phialocephala subalpina]
MASETPDGISQKVQESLKDGPYACSSLAKLSGGTANFVYRGTLVTLLKDGEKTVVIKHTEGYVASNPNFKLTDTRCDYEQQILSALNTLPPLTKEGVEVETPHLYHFDAESNTQVYSDLPSSLDLKTYVLSHSTTLTEPQCQRLGFALGSWAKSFHVWANGDERKGLREVMKGNKEMRDLKFRINYENLVATIPNFEGILGESRGVFEGVRKSVRKELDESDGELIHGDFWSGNILLPEGSIADSSDKVLRIFIIDWELSQLSHPAFDLGQMIAELYELKHFKDIDAGLWLIKSFIEGYGDMDEEMKWKTIIHAGTHLVCWGSRVQGWGSKEQVEDVVRVGRDWILGAVKRERAVFEGMVLENFFK